MPRTSMSLPRKSPSLLSRITPMLLAGAAAMAAGCVLYGPAEEYKTCDDVVCGNNASCAEETADCYCEAGFEGNPYEGCKSVQPEVDPECKLDCGQNAYCSEGACYCELDHVAVCGANAGCLPETRLCDGMPDCPNQADENVAVCEAPLFQDWLVTDDCDDGLPIEWRLFSQVRDWSWPGADTTFLTTGLGAEDYQTIQCFSGEMICFAGKSGETVWGFNLDGSGSCDECCAPCGGDTVLDLGFLSCNGG